MEPPELVIYSDQQIKEARTQLKELREREGIWGDWNDDQDDIFFPTEVAREEERLHRIILNRILAFHYAKKRYVLDHSSDWEAAMKRDHETEMRQWRAAREAERIRQEAAHAARDAARKEREKEIRLWLHDYRLRYKLTEPMYDDFFVLPGGEPWINCYEEWKVIYEYCAKNTPWILPNRPWRWNGDLKKHYRMCTDPYFLAEEMNEMGKRIEEQSFRKYGGKVVMRRPKVKWSKETSKNTEENFHAHLAPLVQKSAGKMALMTIIPAVDGTRTNKTLEWFRTPMYLEIIYNIMEKMPAVLRYVVAVETYPGDKPTRKGDRKAAAGEMGGPPVDREDAQRIEEPIVVNGAGQPRKKNYATKAAKKKKAAAKAVAESTPMAGEDREPDAGEVSKRLKIIEAKLRAEKEKSKKLEEQLRSGGKQARTKKRARPEGEKPLPPSSQCDGAYEESSESSSSSSSDEMQHAEKELEKEAAVDRAKASHKRNRKAYIIDDVDAVGGSSDEEEEEGSSDISDLISEGGEDEDAFRSYFIDPPADSYFSILRGIKPIRKLLFRIFINNTEGELISGERDRRSRAELDRLHDEQQEREMMAALGLVEEEEVEEEESAPDIAELSDHNDTSVLAIENQTVITPTVIQKPAAPAVSFKEALSMVGSHFESEQGRRDMQEMGLFNKPAAMPSAKPAAPRVRRDEILSPPPSPPQLPAPKKPAARVSNDEDPPRPNPPTGEDGPSSPEHSLAGFNHFHLEIWFTEINADEPVDMFAAQRALLLPIFKFISFAYTENKEVRLHDVQINPQRSATLKDWMGVERYPLISHDCNLTRDMLVAVNCEVKNAAQMERSSYKHFRQTWESTNLNKINDPDFYALLEHYHYSLRHVAEGGKGIASLSDFYDRARPLSRRIEGMNTPFHDRTVLNLKLRNYMIDHGFAAYQSTDNSWKIYQKVHYKIKAANGSEIECRLTHSYEKKYESIHLFFAFLGRDYGHWADQMERYCGQLMKEIDRIAHTYFPMVEKNWRWVELHDAYFYICDDPNAPNRPREEFLKALNYDSTIERDAIPPIYRTIYRGLPLWFPLPGAQKLQNGTVLSHVNGFLYKRAKYLDHLSNQWKSVDELVTEQLANTCCAFYDKNPGLSQKMDVPDTEEESKRVDPDDLLSDFEYWVGPKDWLKVIGRYEFERCEEHNWTRLEGNERWWVCSRCGENMIGIAADGPNKPYAKPLERRRESWGAADFRSCLNIFRSAFHGEFVERDRALMLYGYSNTGKSACQDFLSVDGGLFDADVHFIPGKGEADLYASLRNNRCRILLGEEWKQKNYNVEDFRKFLEGGNMPARGMKANSSFRSANFHKFFNCQEQYEMRTVTHNKYNPQTKKMEKVKEKVKETFPPFGPEYDSSNALRNRVLVLGMLIHVWEADQQLKMRMRASPVEILVYLVRMRYIPLKERHLWRQETNYKVDNTENKRQRLTTSSVH